MVAEKWKSLRYEYARLWYSASILLACKIINYNYAYIGMNGKNISDLKDPLLRKKKEKFSPIFHLPLSNDECEEQRFQISGNKKLLNLIPDGSIGWNSSERNGKFRIRVPNLRNRLNNSFPRFPGGKRGEISLADSRQTFLSPFFFFFLLLPPLSDKECSKGESKAVKCNGAKEKWCSSTFYSSH